MDVDEVVVEVVYADDNITTIFRVNVRAGFVYKNNQRRLFNYLPGMVPIATKETREDFQQPILLLVE